MICWNDIRQYLRTAMTLGSYYLWFADMEGEVVQDVLCLYPSTENVARKVESRYMGCLRTILSKIVPSVRSIRIAVRSEEGVSYATEFAIQCEELDGVGACSEQKEDFDRFSFVSQQVDNVAMNHDVEGVTQRSVATQQATSSLKEVLCVAQSTMVPLSRAARRFQYRHFVRSIASGVERRLGTAPANYLVKEGQKSSAVHFDACSVQLVDTTPALCLEDGASIQYAESAFTNTAALATRTTSEKDVVCDTFGVTYALQSTEEDEPISTSGACGIGKKKKVSEATSTVRRSDYKEKQAVVCEQLSCAQSNVGVASEKAIGQDADATWSGASGYKAVLERVAKGYFEKTKHNTMMEAFDTPQGSCFNAVTMMRNEAIVEQASLFEPAFCEKEKVGIPSDQYSLLPSSCGMDIPSPANTSKKSCEEQHYMHISYPVKARTFAYSYSSFIVGECNILAHASSRAVCDAKDSGSASLYLSAAPGLGKTHLVQAMGRELHRVSNVRNLHIEYLSAEDFTTQFTIAMQQKRLTEFLARLKSADVFLLEDVHFLQGKEKIQAHLLSVIKALQAKQSRIVVSSSFALKEIKSIDPQLVSCFHQGYVAKIDSPDLAFRKELIQRKASLHQVLLPEAVTDLIAETICSDIRQIESCLKTLILKAQALNSAITLPMALDVLSVYDTQETVFSFDDIVKHVCSVLGVSKERLQSKSRQHECVLARNIIFYVARLATDMTLKEVALQFNRQHSTVIKGISSIEAEVSKSTPKAQQIRSILSQFELHSDACL